MYNVLGSLNSVLLDICQRTHSTAKSGSVAMVELILLLLDKTSLGRDKFGFAVGVLIDLRCISTI